MTKGKEQNKDVHVYSPLRVRMLDDDGLANALRDGCHDALAVLFERYSALVFHIARTIVKDDGEAEEAVQQVFFDLYRAIAQFRPDRGTFRNWLLQFAYHRSINRRQHLLAKKFYNLDGLDLVTQAGVAGNRGERVQLSVPETTRFIEQVLDTLAPKQRRVIELTYFGGFTAEEIAEKLGETAAVVRHDLYRGLSQLRGLLLDARKSGREVKAKRERDSEGILVAHPRTL